MLLDDLKRLSGCDFETSPSALTYNSVYREPPCMGSYSSRASHADHERICSLNTLSSANRAIGLLYTATSGEVDESALVASSKAPRYCH